MKVIVEIPDNEATFGMKVLKSLTFIKKAKPMTVSAVELWDELKETGHTTTQNTKKEKIRHRYQCKSFRGRIR